ncbi:nitronate monooxygenase [PVC group bacterium]|nr:nitronate monooxygenase [PVC group bacterium]
MIDKLKPLVIGDIEVKIPIVQGGMGVRVSLASLASAVADYGGAGTISSVGLGFGSEDHERHFVKASNEGLEKEIDKAKALTKGVIGVNIMVALSNFEELVRTTARRKADYIAAGAGLPLKLPEYVEGSSIKLIPIVSSARAADIIMRTWKKRYNRLPDAIIVEGPLAGGHLGFKFEEVESKRENVLEDLFVDVLKRVRQYEKDFNVNIPVIAAGGVFDGKDAAKYFRLGARGVQLGSRFVVTHECSVAHEFKELYLKAREEDIVIIKSPVGMPGRVIRTKFVDRVMSGERVPVKCLYRCLKTCVPKTTPYCIAKALYAAAEGDIDNAVVFAGSNVSRITKIVSVKELMDEIVEDAIKELAIT